MFQLGFTDLTIGVLLFAIPVTATSWRGLAWRAVIAAGLTLTAFLISTEGRFSLQVEAGDANIAAGIVLVYAMTWFGAGFAARILSLTARGLGHPRPWSLWIEAACFIAIPALFGAWILS